MKLRIFMLAFAAGFAVFMAFAGFMVLRYAEHGKNAVAEEPAPSKPYLDVEYANFLLIFTDDGEAEAFALVGLDGKSNRIPVFGFSPKLTLELRGNRVSAAELFSATETEVFLGAAEKALSVPINGYFILDRNACETVLTKTGGFDYILPNEINYTDGNKKINLSAGNQSINGKKFCDILFYDGFSEDERANTLSRMVSLYFGSRLRRFSSDREKMYSLLCNYTVTDIDAYDNEELSGLVDFLANSRSVTAGHVKCETKADEKSGLLLFTSSTAERLASWFNE